MSTIKQALISVSDKTGVIELAQGLRHQGVNILSTGGTARLLIGKETRIETRTLMPRIVADNGVPSCQSRLRAGSLVTERFPDGAVQPAATLEHITAVPVIRQVKREIDCVLLAIAASAAFGRARYMAMRRQNEFSRARWPGA